MTHSNLDQSKIRNPLARKNKTLLNSSLVTTSTEVDSRIHQKSKEGVSGLLSFRTERDPKNFTKVFDTPIAKNMVFKLKPRSYAVFVWLLYHVKYRDETVTLEYKHCGKKISLSENTFREAIDDLLKAEIISRIGKSRKSKDYNQFFINPEIIFKGKAFEFYREQASH